MLWDVISLSHHGDEATLRELLRQLLVPGFCMGGVVALANGSPALAEGNYAEQVLFCLMRMRRNQSSSLAHGVAELIDVLLEQFVSVDLAGNTIIFAIENQISVADRPFVHAAAQQLFSIVERGDAADAFCEYAEGVLLMGDFRSWLLLPPTAAGDGASWVPE
jgi:hypothetical protein